MRITGIWEYGDERKSFASGYDGVPSNGLAFSCRERTQKRPQKPNDLAREAVSCNAGLGARADRCII